MVYGANERHTNEGISDWIYVLRFRFGGVASGARLQKEENAHLMSRRVFFASMTRFFFD